MNGITSVERVRVSVGGDEVASGVGLHLLGEVADRVGLTSEFSGAISRVGERVPTHDRGTMLTQAAVMLAGGGRSLADVAVLRDQPELFGPVASDVTFWRLFDRIDDRCRDAIGTARAAARERAWAAGAGPDLEAGEALIIDIDATLVEIHSENKEEATPHYKRGFGFHPMAANLDATGEVLAVALRAGNATANSALDQLGIVDAAMEALPAEMAAGHRAGDDSGAVERPVVVRADAAGCVKGFVCGLVARNIEFSVNARTSGDLWGAIRNVPSDAWQPAIDLDGRPRPNSHVTELDPSLAPKGWPTRTRVICRREPMHPGAQMRLWDTDTYRYQVVYTNSDGDAVELELRQRLHARVENRIKVLKDCGLDRMPFTTFAANQAWCEAVVTATCLLTWTQHICFDGDLARAEPRTLRFRILGAAARLVRHARRTILRIPETWPWAADLATAYERVAVLGT